MDWEFAVSLTVTGIVVVFVVLVVLCMLIKLFGFALSGAARKGSKGEKKDRVADAVHTEKSVQPADTVKNAETDGTIAAISAAVAYMMECCGMGPDDYRITNISRAKKLRRSAQGVKPRSAWSAAGISDAMR